MERCSLGELVTAVKGEFLSGDPHTAVKSICIDSREVRNGDFFIAISGKKYDGHDFLHNVVEKKAGGVIVSRQSIDIGNPFPVFPAIIRVENTLKALGDLAAFYRKKWKAKITAITGSNGKTTTKEMLASILNNDGSTLKNSGNYNNQVGLPLTLLNLGQQHKYAVVEMGTSFPGEIARLSEIASADMGIITNIGLAHIENFKNQEGVLEEKKTLLESLPEDGCAFINADDPYLAGIAEKLKKEVITFGFKSQAIVKAKNIKLWPGFPSFYLDIMGDFISINLPVYGEFNIYNALAAAAAGWKLGIGLELIKKGLESFKVPDMRMQVRNLFSDTTIINDAYNANPTSMRQSILSFVSAFPGREKIVVLGDMLELGSSAEVEHAKLGEFLATQPITQIYLFGPLMEKAFKLLESTSAKHFLKKEDLEEELKHSLIPEAVVFFKASRGMTLEEVINNVFPEE